MATHIAEKVVKQENELEIEEFEDISMDKFAAVLLKENLILTALELHTELVEKGKEVPRLRDYFSNPGNFEKQDTLDSPPVLPRTSSIQTFDSLDFTRYSDDADRQVDEKVAVLEFELRKAKDTIKALRANLTVVTESDPNSPDAGNDKVVTEDVKPHEKRAINFLVNEYLLKNNYKLTSITFCDENEDQDFDDWDDVGLNIPRPPELLQLYRNYLKHIGLLKTVSAASCQTDERIQESLVVTSENPFSSDGTELLEKERELNSLQDQLRQSVHEKTKLLEELRAIKQQSELTSEKNTFRDCPVCRNKKQSESSSDFVKETTSDDVPIASLSRKVPHAFQRALLGTCSISNITGNSRLADELATIIETNEDVVLRLSRCLPHIVPNVLLAKREELIPVILCTISLHPNAKERDKLLNILFNLIKRPDDDQRKMILTGFVAIAQHLGPERVESELLPQCWEQISHKYIERRLLVAESCGVLAPYVAHEIRSSLILSMLQQMLQEEKEAHVRQAAAKSLAVLITLLEDDHKFLQAEELLFAVLEDASSGVSDVGMNILLPVVAQWAKELGKLQSHLYATLLRKLPEEAKRLTTECTDESNVLSQGDNNHVLLIVRAMHVLNAFLFVSVIESGPWEGQTSESENLAGTVDRLPLFTSQLQDPAVIIGDSKEMLSLVSSFDRYISEEWYKSWDSFDWVVNTFIPSLLRVLTDVDIVKQNVVQSFSDLLRNFSQLFGRVFVQSKVKSQFEEFFQVPEEITESQQHDCKNAYTSAIVPVYTAAVFGAFHTTEDQRMLTTFLKDALFLLAQSSAPLHSINSSFQILSSHSMFHELLLSILWDGVVHSSDAVRTASGKLFNILIGVVDEQTLQKRVVPALVTLASDPNVSVKAGSVSAFGTILELSTQKDLLDKVQLQMQNFLDDPVCRGQHLLVLEMIHTFARVGPNTEPKFRDEFVLPRLAALAAQNNQAVNEAKKLDVALALLEAYSTFACCFMNDQLLGEAFLPGLRFVYEDLKQAPKESEAALLMIHEFESKLDLGKTTESQAFNLSQTSIEDMRNKVTKMFTANRQSAARSSIPNLFQIRKK